MILTGCVNVNGEQAVEEATPKAIPPISISRGINLGNWLEAPEPGDWGVMIEPRHFSAIREAGFDSVRIPVRFSAHASAHPPYTLDPIFMDIVDEAIQQGLQNGLYVILDFHHYEEIMQAPQEQAERFLAIWRQLAERYHEADDNLYFELLNEPHGRMDDGCWNDLLAKAIGEIRVSNPERWIIVGGVDFNHIDALDEIVLLEDERIIATFHFYEPFKFSHQGASWVENAAQWSGVQWTGSEEEKQAIETVLDEATQWSRLHGMPWLMGEFGVIAKADETSRQRWSAFMADQARQRGIAWIYWDICGEFQVMDCGTGKWDQSLLGALMGGR